MNKPHMAPGRRISLFLHRWHRRAGVVTCLFVLWMVISGWLLNHTGYLQLGRMPVRQLIITSHYGLHTTIPKQTFVAGDHWLLPAPDGLILDGKLLSEPLKQPLGMVLSNGMLFIANADNVLILQPDGSLVDHLTRDLLPASPLVRMGKGCDGLVVSNGGENWVTPDGLGWQPCSGKVIWSQQRPLTAPEKAASAELLRPSISMERLIEDLHSGRFFGSWGPYVVDAFGLAFCFLALSGLWMFTHQRRRRRKHHAH